ncbi:bifunctional peptidase and arginyl-hydroxylase JMJD5-like [Lytechinus variegatus]|uniref:bifunctional peptidase and arginyl-hydroxylase JMJD5-like n=1 Tax=Lytechinus variegatus TaxID=7654 RepID=UPI001BB2AB37|nr:bifunctional peptidase and arginyl-hydroxylase JMJD5-like [Lytechinus variegatus]
MNAETFDIPRISAPSDQDFRTNYLRKGVPVVITDVADKWPASQWTLDELSRKAGHNKAFIRQQTDKESYKVGKSYSIRESPLREYIDDIRAENSRARSSYLAVQNIRSTFPELETDIDIPGYVEKLHGGPYLWIAMKGHYEFCHFDPDDGLLVILNGSKRVKLYGCDIQPLYPNPLGSRGRTIQAQVNCDTPDLKAFPKFKGVQCHQCTLNAGEMLFIPAFWWHQVTSLEMTISINFFYGDAGDNIYLTKIMEPMRWQAFSHWFLNIVEQNRPFESFQRVLENLPDSLRSFFLKTWHEKPSQDQQDRLVKLVLEHLNLDSIPTGSVRTSKHPPVMKIRGLLWRK